MQNYKTMWVWGIKMGTPEYPHACKLTTCWEGRIEWTILNRTDPKNCLDAFLSWLTLQKSWPERSMKKPKSLMHWTKKFHGGRGRDRDKKEKEIRGESPLASEAHTWTGNEGWTVAKGELCMCAEMKLSSQNDNRNPLHFRFIARLHLAPLFLRD